jgi:choice-of-anchor C domain-containing protein
MRVASFVGAGLVLLASAHGARAAQFGNGNFIAAPGGCADSCTVPAGSTALVDWKITRGSIDVANGPASWQAPPLGGYSVDLDGAQPGTLQQVFNTVAGKAYTVTFFLSGNPDGGAALKRMKVSLAGKVYPFSYDTAAHGNTRAAMNYVPETLSFTATAAHTALTFISADAASSTRGAVIGNLAVAPVLNPSEAVIYSFQGSSKVATNDGAHPSGDMSPDSTGTLFGTTLDGGPNLCAKTAKANVTCGTVFALKRPAAAGGAWTEQVVYSFSQNQGWGPAGGLMRDPGTGIFYGTTQFGGPGCGVTGCGVVFSLQVPAGGGPGVQTVIHQFNVTGAGTKPNGRLVRDSGGTLYGSTQSGSGGYGTIFKMTPPASAGMPWGFTVLYRFTGQADGSFPNDISLGADGAIYGTETSGVAGAVFRLSPPVAPATDWTLVHLQDFQTYEGGYNPLGPVTIDPVDGTIYGTTSQGGIAPGSRIQGYGTAFRLTPSATLPWPQTILFHFLTDPATGQPTEGATPSAALIEINGGSMLYGTAQGGTAYCGYLCGNAFALTPPAATGVDWTLSQLHIFTGAVVSDVPNDGAMMSSGFHLASDGTLYGVTSRGGTGTGCPFQGCGTVYRITPY